MRRTSVMLAWLSLLSGALSGLAGDADWWIPGPPSLRLGAIVDGHVLSYAWRPSEAPGPRSGDLNRHRVPAEAWIAAATWEPKDIEWFLADLPDGPATPLKEKMPYETAALASLRNGLSPHHAPHRWRLAAGYFWGTRIDAALSGMSPNPHSTTLAWMPFDPRHPATSHAGGTTLPPSWSEDVLGALARDARGDAPLHPREWADRVAAFRQMSAVLTPLSRLPFLDEIASRGMWWWEDWRPARADAPKRMDVDLLPTEGGLAIFALSENGMSIWTNQWRRRTGALGESCLRDSEWRREATFRSPFVEPFHVAAGEGQYFFVTESGAVYAASEAGGAWETRILWKDAARPIRAMLFESDGATAYAFGNDFYFKLGRDAEAKACPDVTGGPADSGEPMRTVVARARVLNARGELK